MATLRMSLTYPNKGVGEGRAQKSTVADQWRKHNNEADSACRNSRTFRSASPGSRPPVKSNFLQVPAGMASTRLVTGILPNIHAVLRTFVVRR